MELRELLLQAIQKKASDLHLTENTPPVLRIDGKLLLTKNSSLSRDDLKKMIYAILSDYQKEKFEKDHELDFSLALPGLDRFRANVHIQRGTVEAAFRRIPLLFPVLRNWVCRRLSAIWPGVPMVWS